MKKLAKKIMQTVAGTIALLPFAFLCLYVVNRYGLPFIKTSPGSDSRLDQAYGVSALVVAVYVAAASIVWLKDDKVDSSPLPESGEESPANDRPRLLERLAQASRARLIERWLVVGVDEIQAKTWASDARVGTHDSVDARIPDSGLVAIEGEFGSGKSAYGERLHLRHIAEARTDDRARIPVHLAAQQLTEGIYHHVAASAEGLGDPSVLGFNLILDGIDEPGNRTPASLLEEARTLAQERANCLIVITARPGLDLLPNERIEYPRLSKEESSKLIQSAGGDPRIFLTASKDLRDALEIPLFVLIAALLQKDGQEIPRSPGDFIDALVSVALKRQRPNGEARKLLLKLADASVCLGGLVPAGEVGSPEDIDTVLATRLVVRAGRAVRFSLPILEQYFVGLYMLENGVPGSLLADLASFSRWRYSLVLAIAGGSTSQVTAIMDSVLESHPGAGAWLVSEAVPVSGSGKAAESTAMLDKSSIIREIKSKWLQALGPIASELSVLDNGGDLKAILAGNILMEDFTASVADARTEILPGPQGARYSIRVSHNLPIDHAAWPWELARKSIAESLTIVLDGGYLPLPAANPANAERRWAMARGLMGQNDPRHQPIPVDLLTERAINKLAEYPAGSDMRISIGNMHAVKLHDLRIFAEEIGEEAFGVDGMLIRPYPVPSSSAAIGRKVWSNYTDEDIRSLVERVYENALEIYGGIVSTWFPGFTPMLGLACALPIQIDGVCKPAGADDLSEIPTFMYQMECIALGEKSNVNVRLAAEGEILAESLDDLQGKYHRSYALAQRWHPESIEWARLWSSHTVVQAFGNRPATSIAYHWLSRDLKALRVIERVPGRIRD